MQYKKIDLQTWRRKEHFEFFSRSDFPFYSTTFMIDVTNFYHYTKQKEISFYQGMIYETIQAMNSTEAFRYRIREDGVILCDKVCPSFTDTKKGDDLFYIVTMDMEDIEAGSMEAYCQRAEKKSKEQTVFMTTTGPERDELVFFTCLPWISLTSLTNERNFDKNDSYPRVAWGKFEKRDGRLMLPYSVEVNHRLIDGVHIGELAVRLQERLDMHRI